LFGTKKYPGRDSQPHGAGNRGPADGQVIGKHRDPSAALPRISAAVIQKRARQDQQHQEARQAKKKPAQQPREPMISNPFEHPALQLGLDTKPIHHKDTKEKTKTTCLFFFVSFVSLW
jgi:hypothetical protein